MVRGLKKGTVQGLTARSKTQCGDTVKVRSATKGTLQRHATKQKKLCEARSEVRGVIQGEAVEIHRSTRRDRSRRCAGTVEVRSKTEGEVRIYAV